MNCMIFKGDEMRKLFFIFLSMIYMSLFAQEESEISMIDVIESIEDVNKKLDRLMPENRIDEANLELGFVPITGRHLLGVSELNSYVSKSGDYETFSGSFFPFINGFEIFSNLKLKDNILIGLNYFTYIQNTHGLHSALSANKESDAVSFPLTDEYKSEDKNQDGKVDFYSYSNYFFTGIELTSKFIKRLNPKSYVSIGPKIGYGYEELEFAAYERVMFSNISPSDKVSWRRTNIILGADLGLAHKFKSVEIAFTFGLSYNLPISDWEPVAGVSDTDKAPEDFNNMNLKISLGPVISLKF